MPSSNDNKLVSTAPAPGYTKTVIGKDMPKTKSSSSTPTSSSGQSSTSTRDPNPMSASNYAKMAKAMGLPFTSPVRPTF
ncbi:hypothetical protein P691DRAFT_758053 [Macrolepiota fuliginosa MF-IS2]|uniref:Uncharacterized protein n=1 Tax=Macrolepiota fuliginosa MF-IS2 TaxID=1400762 RepID=A0A9P5XJ76_9AGAR|nr:hypothetical protein P691DRAFT_758053 [Macrolepiota fuliginosa MF-IS2]